MLSLCDSIEENLDFRQLVENSFYLSIGIDRWDQIIQHILRKVGADGLSSLFAVITCLPLNLRVLTLPCQISIVLDPFILGLLFFLSKVGGSLKVLWSLIVDYFTHFLFNCHGSCIYIMPQNNLHIKISIKIYFITK